LEVYKIVSILLVATAPCGNYSSKSNIIFSRRILKDPLTFFYNNYIIGLAKEYKYLGVIYKTNGQLKYASEIRVVK
jgi:hypothetical protein